jgi:hypothetical protein
MSKVKIAGDSVSDEGSVLARRWCFLAVCSCGGRDRRNALGLLEGPNPLTQHRGFQHRNLRGHFGGHVESGPLKRTLRLEWQEEAFVGASGDGACGKSEQCAASRAGSHGLWPCIAEHRRSQAGHLACRILILIIKGSLWRTARAA